MPRPCQVCVHEQRAEIDQALVAGEPHRNVAKRFGTSAPATYRHRRQHLPVALLKAREAVEIQRGDNLLDQLRNLHARALAILDAAEQAGALETALRAIRELRGNLELLARLLGELNSAPSVNILVAPDFIRARMVILETLEGYPEARLAVAKRLIELESRDGRSA